MLAPLHRTLKRCFHPVYRRLPEPLQLTLRRIQSKMTGQATHLWRPAGEPPADPFLDHLRQSDRLLLAALKLTEAPSARSAAPEFQAVSLGNDRLLAAHPVLPFIYLDARELRQTPHIVAGRFQPGLSLLLHQVVRPGDRVLEIGAGQGYHTLSLAHLVGADGEVAAAEAEAGYAAVLRDNVAAHDLEDRVEVVHSRDAAGAGHDVIRVDERCLSADVLAALGGHDGQRVVLSFDARRAQDAAAIRSLSLPLWQLADGELEPVGAEQLLAGAAGRVDVVAARQRP